MNVCKCGSLGREKIIIVSNNYSPFSFPAHREEKKERMKERGNLVARGGEPFKSRAIQMESVSLNISHRRRLHQVDTSFYSPVRGREPRFPQFFHASRFPFSKARAIINTIRRAWPSIHSTAESRNRQNTLITIASVKNIRENSRLTS